jgi:hypothetical protein
LIGRQAERVFSHESIFQLSGSRLAARKCVQPIILCILFCKPVPAFAEYAQEYDREWEVGQAEGSINRGKTGAENR